MDMPREHCGCIGRKVADADRIDGTVTSITVTSAGYIMIGVLSVTEIFNKITVKLGSTVNTNAATLTGEYWDGAEWQSLTSFVDGTLDGGKTMAVDGEITFDLPDDWNPGNVENVISYYVRLKPSATLTAVDMEYIVMKRQNNTVINIPAIAAGEWKWVRLALNQDVFAGSDERSIRSVGINVSADVGANSIYLQGIDRAAMLVADALDTASLHGERLQGLEVYGGSVDEPRENPWVFSAKSLIEIQTQNEDVAIALPLREMEELAHFQTGEGSTVNGVYLYFNLGEKIQRYYNRQLDDIGPDRDAGMPVWRNGVPVSMASYPGHVVTCLDGGEGGYSCILMGSGSNDWHEVYRAPRSGLRIRNIGIQSVPGSTVQRLFFSMGNDILWVPLSLNPEQAQDYRFAHEATLHIGRIIADAQDVEKFWNSIKLLTKNLSSTVTVAVDYQVDSDGVWHEAVNVFDTSPSQEEKFSADYTAAGKWVELRIRAMTESNIISPVLLAIVIDDLKRYVTKWYYPITFRITDDDTDLNGDPDPVPNGQDKIDLLDKWTKAPTPVRMDTWTSGHEDSYVYPEATPVKVLAKIQEEGREIRICQVDLLEV